MTNTYFNIKMSCFKQIKFITEDDFTEHTNMTTKLKLCIKVIKMPSEEASVDIQRVRLKVRGSASTLIESGAEKLSRKRILRIDLFTFLYILIHRAVKRFIKFCPRSEFNFKKFKIQMFLSFPSSKLC
jgi:hypothetical protein